MRRSGFALMILMIMAVSVAGAGEVGHFSPGLASIRDFVVPAPGFYGILYNYGYMSDQINDSEGEEISQVTIGQPPMSATLDLDVDVDVTVFSPGLMWASNWKIFGATYAACFMVPLANTSIGASLATQTGAGRSVDESQFGLGDMFVQPLWLGWNKPHADFALGYGLYIPTGRYETETVAIPVVGEIRTEATDNIGLGFLTHQLQGAFSWYPWTDRRMAVAGALSWEIHGEKEDFDLTPGQNLSLNWGVSQYLPLNTKRTLIAEIGPAGYDSWQVTDDDGAAARNPSVHDDVHGVGMQLGAIYVPWRVTANLRYLYEFAASDRFDGQSIGLNLAKSF